MLYESISLAQLLQTVQSQQLLNLFTSQPTWLCRKKKKKKKKNFVLNVYEPWNYTI